MTTKVEKSILVNVPIGTAYNQWTQFEDFPQFMGGVKTVTQVDDRTLHWVAEIGGVKREWDATVLEQVPDEKVAWAATSGATNAGAVYFEAVSTEQTSVRLSLEYEPEGLVEKVGDKLNIVGRQAESDLQRFKEFIESERYATGAWRGSINEGAGIGTPGVDSAAASQGDSGKAGFSAKTVLAAAAVAGAGIAAASMARSSSDDAPSDATVETDVEPVVVEQVDYVAVGTEPVADTTSAFGAHSGAGYAASDLETGTNLGGSGDAPAYATDVPGIPDSGTAPVTGTPALSGMTGTPGAENPYAADDESVTEFTEHHRDETDRLR